MTSVSNAVHLSAPSHTTVRWLTTGARLGLGAVFFIFGLNGFLRFLPMPPPSPGPASDYLQGLLATGYIIPLVKGVEVLCGVLLLSNRFVSLALVLLAPIVVNITLFHVGIAHDGYAMVLFILGTQLWLAWQRRADYAGVLSPA